MLTTGRRILRLQKKIDQRLALKALIQSQAWGIAPGNWIEITNER
jgi:hypothetical protein